MTERDPIGPLEESELVRLAGSTPVTAPSTVSRDRARRAFLTGRRGDAAPTPAGRRPRPRAYVPLALAAGLLGLVIWGLQPVERWTVLAAPGTALIGARPARVGDELRGGLVITREDTELDVQLGQTLRLVLGPSSHAVLPRGPGRWLGTSRTLFVERGEIFGTTRGAPLGFALTVVTPEAEARVLGTTFAVTRNERGPCFCLYEGELEVSAGGREPVRVPQETRIQIFTDGSSPQIVELTETERTKLRMIRDAGLAARSGR